MILPETKLHHEHFILHTVSAGYVNAPEAARKKRRIYEEPVTVVDDEILCRHGGTFEDQEQLSVNSDQDPSNSSHYTMEFHINNSCHHYELRKKPVPKRDSYDNPLSRELLDEAAQAAVISFFPGWPKIYTSRALQCIQI